MNASADAFTRISDVPVNGLASEEDVKNKIMLPLLRALGYDDADFNYERRTGRGYVDVVVERFPVGIVVETKSPRTRLTDDCIEQLEDYAFHKHTRDRAATVAILTNGEWFYIYGVIERLQKGSLHMQVIYCLKRSQLGDPACVSHLVELLAREKNQEGTIPHVITRRQEEMRRKRARLREIDTAIQALTAERDRIEAQIQHLESERKSIVEEVVPGQSPSDRGVIIAQGWRYPASPHILRLLGEQGAQSKSATVQRRWLDEQLVGKVEVVPNQQAVSWGLIELKKADTIDYEKRGGTIRLVWLT